MYLTDSLTNGVTTEVMEEVAEKISFSQFSLPALRDFGIKFLIALVVYYIGHRLIIFTRKLFVKAANKTNADVSVTHFFGSIRHQYFHRDPRKFNDHHRSCSARQSCAFCGRYPNPFHTSFQGRRLHYLLSRRGYR